MKRRMLIVASLVLMLALIAFSSSSVSAQSAANQSWRTAITYYTPSATAGNLQIAFYAEGSATPIMADPIALAPHQAGTLLVSNVTGLPAGFSGSAVMNADVPIVAVDVQIAGAAADYARPLYTGFAPEDADTTFYIPTFLYQRFNNSTTMGIQNVESSSIQVAVKAYEVGQTTPTYNQTHTIQSNSTIIMNGADMSLPAGFNGSVVVDGTIAGGGRVVASAYEAEIAGRAAKAFEGVAGGSNSVYLASMLCNAFSDNQISFFAIQNASLSSAASVTATFYNTSGAVVGTMPATNIAAGNKISVNPCNEGVPSGTSGSAVFQSTGAPIIAMGKVNSQTGFVTAFVGEAAGSTKSAASYIRWPANFAAEYRANIAVMNVGNATANSVQVRYYNWLGNLVATHNIAPLGQFIKGNSNPQTAGALDALGEFGINNGVSGVGGAVEIVSDQPVVVVVRLARNVNFAGVTRFAEDYSSKPVP
jgi:hypothetical protein